MEKEKTFVFPVTDQGLKNLSNLMKVTIDSLVQIVRRLDDFPGSSEEDALHDIFLDIVGEDSQAQELDSFIRGMRRNLEDYDISASDLLASVEAGMRSADADNLILKQWNDRKGHFEKILNHPVVARLVKSRLLSRRGDQHVHSILIATGLVPIFDQEHSEISSYIVENTLYIRHADRNEDERIFQIGLTEEDLRRLLKQAEEAGKKTEIVKKTLMKQNMPFVVHRTHP